MAHLRDLAHSFKTISSVRPEQKAVPSTAYKPLLEEFAMREGRQRIQGMRQSSRRFRTEVGIRDYKRYRKSARRDVAAALPIEIGGLLVSHRAASERSRVAAEQEKQNKMIAEGYAELQKMVAEYPKAFRRIMETGYPQAELPYGMQP